MATSASSRGWGAPCSGTIVTIVRKDGLRLPVRKDIAELVALLCDETERLGYDIKPGQTWGYACRKIRGSVNWSNHAWALAVDINSSENPMGPRNGRIRRFPKVIAVWKKYGFRWGGDYSGRADDMHFEFLGTPDDAKRHTWNARKELGQEDDLTEDQAKKLEFVYQSVKRDGPDGEPEGIDKWLARELKAIHKKLDALGT